MIPEWMKEVDQSGCECYSKARGRKSFVKKTLDGILGFFHEAFVSEETAKRPGLLQGLDPRVKLISSLALVFSLSVVKELSILLAVYLLILALAYVSRIGVFFFIKRVWLFIPIFTGVIAIPMIFNVFFPGECLYNVAYLDGHIGPFSMPGAVCITRQGLFAATIFTLRVAACVSAVVLLFLTTPQQLLFKSLRAVGVPKVYVLTLGMAYRYIFLFLDTVKDLYIAKRSRTIRSKGTVAEQRWVGGRIGYMLIKSLDMSEKVHMAMISRGFNGDVKILHDYAVTWQDYAAGTTALALSVVLVLRSMALI